MGDSCMCRSRRHTFAHLAHEAHRRAAARREDERVAPHERELCDERDGGGARRSPRESRGSGGGRRATHKGPVCASGTAGEPCERRPLLGVVARGGGGGPQGCGKRGGGGGVWGGAAGGGGGGGVTIV